MNDASLTQQEKEVLNDLKEISRKNGYFTLKEIHDDAAKIDQINLDELELIIKSIIKKADLICGPRLNEDQIMSDITRKSLYQLIKNEPGISFTQLAKNCDLNDVRIIWHLEILDKYGFIKSHMKNKETCYYIS